MGSYKMAIVYKDGKPVVVPRSEVEDAVEELPEIDYAEDAVQQDLSRRRMMRSAFLGTMGAFLIGGGATYLMFFWPTKVGTFGSVITAGKIEDFPPGSVTKFPDGRLWLNHIKDEDGGGFMALYWKCVHLGCTVPWKPDENGTYKGKTYVGIFHCPCHGSEYLYTGQNFAGPAPRPLDYMEVTFAGGMVKVNTGKISSRSVHDPKQAAKPS